jgi:capsular exopolysaccharide synthesis family protein
MTISLATPQQQAAKTRHFSADPAQPVASTLPLHHRGEQVVALEAKKVYTQLISLLNPDMPEAEHYRRLRYSVERLKKKDQGLVIGLTSPVSGDGKTMTSINLAGALAQNPQNRVLLVELDLRQPVNTLRNYLGAPKKLAGPGVVDLVVDPSLPWEKATYFLQDYNLYLLPAGSPTRSPYELLNSERMDEVLREARQRYDYVIVDTAPVVLMPDSQLVADSVDGFLVVLAADITPKKLLEEALALMDPNKVLGLVFNGYKPVGERYGGYY